jgi:molybdate transport system ATP-binding protein
VLSDGKVAAQGSPGEISLAPALRAIVGPDSVGAVIDGVITGVDPQTKMAQLRIAGGMLRVSARDISGASDAATLVGLAVRVQLLARDVILATEAPRGLSVRNVIEGVVAEVSADEGDAAIVRVDIGGATVLSRVTLAAVEALKLQKGMRLWVLVKAVSLRGHAFTSKATTPAS